MRQAWHRLDAAAGAAADGAVEERGRRTRRTRCRLTLFRAIARARRAAPLTVHLAESPEEIEFLQPARGRSASCSRSSAPGRPAGRRRVRSGRVPRPPRLPRHPAALSCTACISRATPWSGCASAESVLVTCPRSNGWVGAGMPPVAAVLRVGGARGDRHRQPGVESRRSTCSTSWRRCGAWRRKSRRRRCSRAPRASAREALGLRATVWHARARASGPRSIAVRRAGRDATDVEEYLVGGVDSRDVRRI